MLNITFYKGCIVDNTYAEVFDLFNADENGATAFSRYLASLESYSIQLTDVYLTDSGKLDIDLTIYGESVIHRFEQFNYMRLSDNAGSIARYCFIDEFRIINGMAVFSYSTDVWHTYAAAPLRRAPLTKPTHLARLSSFMHKLYKKCIKIHTVSYVSRACLSLALARARPRELVDDVAPCVAFFVYSHCARS